MGNKTPQKDIPPKYLAIVLHNLGANEIKNFRHVVPNPDPKKWERPLIYLRAEMEGTVNMTHYKKPRCYNFDVFLDDIKEFIEGLVKFEKYFDDKYEYVTLLINRMPFTKKEIVNLRTDFNKFYLRIRRVEEGKTGEPGMDETSAPSAPIL